MGLHTILYVTERDTLKEIVQFSRDAYMRCWSTRVGNEAESKIYGPLPGVYTHISGIDSIQVSIIFFLILIVTVSLSKSLRELGPFHKLLLLFWRICQASTRQFLSYFRVILNQKTTSFPNGNELHSAIGGKWCAYSYPHLKYAHACVVRACQSAPVEREMYYSSQSHHNVTFSRLCYIQPLQFSTRFAKEKACQYP